MCLYSLSLSLLIKNYEPWPCDTYKHEMPLSSDNHAAHRKSATLEMEKKRLPRANSALPWFLHCEGIRSISDRKHMELFIHPQEKRNWWSFECPLRIRILMNPTKMPMLWYLTYQKCNPGKVLEAFWNMGSINPSVHSRSTTYCTWRRGEKKTPHVSTWNSSSLILAEKIWTSESEVVLSKKQKKREWAATTSICTFYPYKVVVPEPSQHGHLGFVGGTWPWHAHDLQWSARLDVACYTPNWWPDDQQAFLMLWVFMGMVLMRWIACETFHLNRSMHTLWLSFKNLERGS